LWFLSEFGKVLDSFRNNITKQSNFNASFLLATNCDVEVDLLFFNI
jgi:hypothetical protein